MSENRRVISPVSYVFRYAQGPRFKDSGRRTGCTIIFSQLTVQVHALTKRDFSVTQRACDSEPYFSSHLILGVSVSRRAWCIISILSGDVTSKVYIVVFLYEDCERVLMLSMVSVIVVEHPLSLFAVAGGMHCKLRKRTQKIPALDLI